METTGFVKQLASNNRKVRVNALEKLTELLATVNFKKAKQLQFDKLWKGLYFSMWFSDKPRPQQRLANELGALFLTYFKESDNSEKNTEKLCMNDAAFIKFSKAFWRVILMEWLNIDKWRLDKYLLLVRRVLYNQLKYMQLRNWDELLVEKYLTKVLKKLPLSGDRKVYTGVPIHITDIFLDEWERLMRNDDVPQEEIADEDFEEKEYDFITLVKETPLPKFIDIFQKLTEDQHVSKVLKSRIKEDLLEDTRLLEWEIINDEDSDEEEEREDVVAEEDNDDDTEWKGF
ncbi:hypothetical protein TPHA_0B03480 [Tetrapisispora phaffii CBS 4417]|uniref:Ribosomal RNA-processing protein 1 n=1 Tax=Tetrapisispora phaffii (strain ATCC 24235 / CBS 4417 / NBRC 1672 / NRRL Y-8282 / UCD 70-5) TaxID=1071381 RepID=G8BPT7_TETPH|nr:hypothetical protein TPHA_0B03480 [Tetrapisispora phaffii CBS 4417]CCE62018.1 hypothetical protein TPHA_0B03480 [Tetrapisispora phaffii CBS 4417]